MLTEDENIVEIQVRVAVPPERCTGTFLFEPRPPSVIKVAGPPGARVVEQR
jgi:hypothetical protein